MNFNQSVASYTVEQSSSAAVRAGLSLQPSAEGISEIWQGEKMLLLGNAANALAAVNNTLPNWDVTHIVCVASNKNTDVVSMHAGGMMVAFSSKEEEKKRKRIKRKVIFNSFFMSDRLRPDEEIDLATYIQEPLAAIEEALSSPTRRDSVVQQAFRGTKETAGSDEGRSGTPPPEEYQPRPLAVLIHCDKGVNRSPTLVMAFLMRHGMSLRDSYQQVLRERPIIDPLPTYRRALQILELLWHKGGATVSDDEPFAMHSSQLQQQTQEDFDEALRLRNESIQNLVAESYHCEGSDGRRSSLGAGQVEE